MEEVGNEHIEEPAVVEIVKFIRKKLPESAGRKPLYTMQRVPTLLRQANDKGFEPELLSIGPFHHEKEGLKPMEEKKLQYLQAILCRNPMVELEEYVKVIKELEAPARECYSESISLEGDFEFEKTMVVDGCFLVEIFLQIRTNYAEKTFLEFISQEMWLPHFITHDILLLENQIPFFILEHIFRLVNEPGSIKDLALLCFRLIHVLPLNNGAKAKENYQHLLDLFHHHCLPPDGADPDTEEQSHGEVEEQFHPNLGDRLVLMKADPDSEEKSHGKVEEQFHPNLEDRHVMADEQCRLNLEDGLVLRMADESFHPDLVDSLRLTTVEEQLPPDLENRLMSTTVEEQFLPTIECTPVEESSIEAVRIEAEIEWQPLDEARRTEVMIEWSPVEEESVREPLLSQGRRGLCTPLDMIRKLVRCVCKPLKEPNGRTKKKDKKKRLPFEIPSAEELQDAGIKFRRKEEMPGNFLDIEFHEKGAVMKIPYLYYSHNLQFIFRNLRAYEQCNPKVGTFFTGYALFMDDLINTAKDVQILRHGRILEHGLGSDEELAQHFNQLSKGVLHYPHTTYLYRQRMKINNYSTDPWNISRANLVREYFHSPWAIISLAGAILALVLTIIQTGLSIYSTFCG